MKAKVPNLKKEKIKMMDCENYLIVSLTSKNGNVNLKKKKSHDKIILMRLLGQRFLNWQSNWKCDIFEDDGAKHSTCQYYQKTKQLYPNCVDKGLMSTQKKIEVVPIKKKKDYGMKNITAIICLKDSHIGVDACDFVAPLHTYRTERQQEYYQLAKEIIYKITTPERDGITFE